MLVNPAKLCQCHRAFPSVSIDAVSGIATRGRCRAIGHDDVRAFASI